MGHNTTFQLRTITTTVPVALICSAVCLYPPQRGENPATPTHSSIQRQGVAWLSIKALTVGEAEKETGRDEVRFPAKGRLAGTAL
jgi:hypothetical protein